MRISDWSSDVCSSDLIGADDFVRHAGILSKPAKQPSQTGRYDSIYNESGQQSVAHSGGLRLVSEPPCREPLTDAAVRIGQAVRIPVQDPDQAVAQIGRAHV